MKLRSTTFDRDGKPEHSHVDLDVHELKDGLVLRVRDKGILRYYNITEHEALVLAGHLINAVNLWRQPSW